MQKTHRDITPRDSRKILTDALCNPNLYGQNQKTSRPHNWILIHLADKNSAVIIEVNETKDNLEVINWHYLNKEALDRKKRQAIREGGLILTLASAAANTPNHLSTDKVSDTSSPLQENGELFRFEEDAVNTAYTFTSAAKAIDIETQKVRRALGRRFKRESSFPAYGL